MSITHRLIIAVAAIAMFPVASMAQERGVSFEIRGGLNVPTFDIADVADAGPSFGGGINIPLNEKWGIRGGMDAGFHDADADGDVTITVIHWIAGLEYRYLPDSNPWLVAVNLGAGAMMFDIEDGDSFTYPAINVGGRLGYAVSPMVDLFASIQGDIAFSDEDEVTTDNAWVWPLAVGVEIATR